jgi:hypothetical protein
MTLDDQIRSNLNLVADTVPRSDSSPVGSIKRRGQVRRRNRYVGLGALAVLVVAGTVLLSNPGADEIFVADGEMLMSTDPPIVQGAESPEPQFDTSGLGDEAPLTPVFDIERIVTLASRHPNAELLRITVLGETPSGVLAMVVHSESDDPDLGRLHMRCVTTELGSSCSGTEIDNVADMLGGLLPGEPGSGPTYTVGGEGDLTWEVPAETSIVALAHNGELTWQPPIADVAVFITDFADGDRFELTAYDTQGNPLDLVIRTVSLGSDDS